MFFHWFFFVADTKDRIDISIDNNFLLLKILMKSCNIMYITMASFQFLVMAEEFKDQKVLTSIAM